MSARRLRVRRMGLFTLQLHLWCEDLINARVRLPGTQAQGPRSRPSHAGQGWSPGMGAGGSSGTSSQWASRAAAVSTPFKCSFATCVGTRGVGAILRVK